jgi:hypothetical protein
VGVLRARIAGRSWWALRYTDGRIIHEWDRDPGSPNGHADWPRLPYRGRQALRLYCPDGKFAQLGDTEDATGKLFQIKVGLMTAGAGRGTLGHLIGMIHGLNGECICYSWEINADGSGRLVGPFDDNVYALRWHGPWGPLSADVLGIDDGEGR